ncbi:hypothetical protein DQ04_01931010 [Trypanosoma grayi]|uniref:hypothetical protein n=1 Tax=Trypanosoma grayi TaxID=71804 RepID=UPI0004F43B03|nr:hypothetical protein DQ04_01931010 [Trypanosoma grayi]KEG12165.1 hypothetical protein DQ04_01931010 [Trypanosoma grayi]
MVNFEKRSGLYTAISESTMMNSKGLCENAQQGTAAKCVEKCTEFDNIGDRSPCMDFYKYDSAFQAPQSFAGAVDSPTSSLCLTEALLTATNTVSSSTLSATFPFPNQINALAMLWEGGQATNLCSLVDDAVDSATDPPPTATVLSNCDSNNDESRFPSTLSGTEASAKHSPSADEVFPMLHVQPYTEHVCFGGLQGKSGGAEEHDVEGNVEVLKASPVISPPLSDVVNSVEEKKDDTMSNDKKHTSLKNGEAAKEGKKETVPVVDPQRAKLHVPLSAITPTKALGGRVQHPSLCLLFQSGRCRQGANCYQMHVDPEVVKELRQIIQGLPCCCTYHGDCNSKLWDAKANADRTIVINRVAVPLVRVAYTSGLSRFVKNEMQRPLSTGVLCRLHGAPGGCRYGADCWYVHVCREILANEAAFSLDTNVTSSAKECPIKTSPQPARTKGAWVVPDCPRNPFHQPHQQFQQQTGFLGIDLHHSAVIENLFQEESNGGASTGNSHDITLSSAMPCVWMYPASSPFEQGKWFQAQLPAGVSACVTGGQPTAALIATQWPKSSCSGSAVSHVLMPWQSQWGVASSVPFGKSLSGAQPTMTFGQTYCNNKESS